MSFVSWSILCAKMCGPLPQRTLNSPIEHSMMGFNPDSKCTGKQRACLFLSISSDKNTDVFLHLNACVCLSDCSS